MRDPIAADSKALVPGRSPSRSSRRCATWLLDLVGLYSELRRRIAAREIRGKPVHHLEIQFERVRAAILGGGFVERN